MISNIILCRYCQREIALLGGALFKDGRWSHRHCYNAAHDEQREAHVDTDTEQYKRDKMRSEVENNGD